MERVASRTPGCLAATFPWLWPDPADPCFVFHAQEKGLTMKAGQTPCQKYWHKLLDMVESGKLNPQVVISHEGPLDAAPHLYKLFNDKQEDCVKVHPRARSCPSVMGP